MEQRFAEAHKTVDEHASPISKLKLQVQHLLQCLGEVRADRPRPKEIDPSFEREVNEATITVRSKGLLPQQNVLRG
eukprot:6474182-Pyramimonas_sp.AAC.1